MSNQAESTIALSDGESGIPNTDAAESSDSDGAFVVLFDDSENENVEAAPESCEDDSSFVILFDENESSDEEENIVSFNEQGHCTIALPSDIRIRQITSLKHTLEKTLDADDVTYDISQVKYIDTSSIQLLHSHLNALKELQVNIHWAGDSEQFSNSAKCLGIELHN